MFAVIKTGGKRYKVAKDTIVVVEKLSAEAGTTIKLDEVLMASDGKQVKVGSPLVEKATVEATVVKHMRGDKLIVFKKKRRHNYRRKKGHRQDLTMLQIQNIKLA